MAQLTIKINGYAYIVSCEDGQEEHLQAMAQELNGRVADIRSLGGQSGEARLLVLAALVMADELHDLGIELAALRKTMTHQQKVAPSFRPAKDAARDERLTRIALRAEEIAAALERP